MYGATDTTYRLTYRYSDTSFRGQGIALTSLVVPRPAPDPVVLDPVRRRLTHHVADFVRAVRRYQAVKAEQERVERFVRAQRQRDQHAAPEPPRVPLHAPHARCCSTADAYRVRGPPLIA